MSKLIIFTAPSGAGKTTIVRHLLEILPKQLAFSISATTREQRAHEKDGHDYYFLSPEEFQRRLSAGEFAEWEEVYENQYYGTLKSEMERIWADGKHILFDIDVKGAKRLKKMFPNRSLAIFVEPPSEEALFSRLHKRRTETDESLRRRFARVKEELTYKNKFDLRLVNDVLSDALETAKDIVLAYIKDHRQNDPPLQ